MKKNIYLFILLAISSVTVKAQNAVPNGDFENWSTINVDQPQGFSGSNMDTWSKCGVMTCVKSTDAYHGNFSMQLSTYAVGPDTCMGYIVSSPNPGNGNPCNWQGGFAYNQQPTGIQGYYKSNIMPGDSGGILVGFRNGTTCLGFYMYKFYGTHNTYTPFSFTFNPPIAGTPDTMIFAAVSSDVFDNIAINGSMLQLDSISLTGVTQQANFNGDFENWQTNSITTPSSWYLQGGGSNGNSGIAQTSDMHAGNYAVELTTVVGDRGGNGGPVYYVAQAGGISTGYYLNNCGGSNCQKGGQPFTNQIDTLAFYYKYAPSGNDTADVGLAFKKNGSNVFYSGRRVKNPASTYQYFEIPFNIGVSIDSVIVSFQSSLWSDSALTYVGSKFKVDDIYFKSQATTGIKTYDASLGIKVFPNPATDGSFTLSNVTSHDLVRVYDVYGQEVNFTIARGSDFARIQMSAPGVYFVYVNARGKVSNLKVIVGGN